MTHPAIAIGNYDFRASGTVAKSIEIAAACAEAGLPVELWVVRDSGPLRATVPPGVPVVEVSRRGRGRGGRSLDLVWSTAMLARELRARRPSVFVSGGNHLHLPAKIALHMSGKRKDIRFVLRASNSSRRPAKKANGAEGALGWSNIFKYKGADVVVAVSGELAEEVRDVGGAHDVVCIPNGVDTGRVRRLATEPFSHPFLAAVSDGARPPVLVSMGRISRQKGFDVLIRALALLPGERNARLLIIGPGPKAGFKYLRAVAQDCGVADRVDFLGYRANPFAILARADLFVSASRWEGASNALLEALAAGLPLVATDCPTGNKEILSGGRYGLVAPVNDPARLADAIAAELEIGRSRDLQRARARQLDIQLCMRHWVDLLRRQHQSSGRAAPELVPTPQGLGLGGKPSLT